MVNQMDMPDVRNGDFILHRKMCIHVLRNVKSILSESMPFF